jgi:hypothetical protein
LSKLYRDAHPQPSWAATVEAVESSGWRPPGQREPAGPDQGRRDCCGGRGGFARRRPGHTAQDRRRRCRRCPRTRGDSEANGPRGLNLPDHARLCQAAAAEERRRQRGSGPSAARRARPDGGEAMTAAGVDCRNGAASHSGRCPRARRDRAVETSNYSNRMLPARTNGEVGPSDGSGMLSARKP